MPLFALADTAFVDCVVDVAYCNPFSRERIARERAALGDAFDDRQPDWNVYPGAETDHPNLIAMITRSQQVLERTRRRLAAGVKPSQPDISRFENVVLFTVYHQYRDDLDRMQSHGTPSPATLYRNMLRSLHEAATGWPRLAQMEAEFPHLFAGFVQIRRAYENIFRFIVGVSQPAVNLRAAVWESIFTHDMRRYRDVMYRHLGDFATLVIGNSGTGKELVARAIGLSRYVPFDPTTGRFAHAKDESFFPVSLAAMSPTLVESELFGHVRGAFTGAVDERKGWLETCPRVGAVFLDEIGELEPSLQVKLLRVLQAREFSRLGETRVRKFTGKIIAATNRQLADEMHAGRFREDLYYRLCSDIVEVPSLAERIVSDPRELAELVRHLVRRMICDASDALVEEVEQAIAQQLGPHYTWPGNVRELEQCVRNLLVRKRYAPPRLTSAARADAFDELAEAMRRGEITADALVRRYCQLNYAQTNSYEATAARLNLDRRTVKARVLAK